MDTWIDLDSLKIALKKRGRIVTGTKTTRLTVTDKRGRRLSVTPNSLVVNGHPVCLYMGDELGSYEAHLIAMFFRSLLDAGCINRGFKAGKACLCWRCKIAKEARSIAGVKNPITLLG